MKGATEYYWLFRETQQIGRLYLVVSDHARGKTFRIYVLPKGENAKPNGSHNPPLNSDAVEVYGVVGGHPGWTEEYGWIKKGNWRKDFDLLVVERKKEVIKQKEEQLKSENSSEKKENERINSLLEDY